MSKDIENDSNEGDNVQGLKEKLNSRRIELDQKDQEIKSLEETVNDLISELKNYKKLEQELKDMSVLEKAHATIDNLLEEKSDLEDQIVILNKKIANLEEKYEIQQQNANALKTMQGYVIELENKIFQLNEQITKLEQEKSAFSQTSEQITSEQEYTSTLENKIVEYDDKINSLEKVNKLHRDTIDKLKADHSSIVANLEQKIKEQNDYVASLVKENRELRKKTEMPKIDRPERDIEGNVIRLQKEIALLKKENKQLNEKNQVLKAALLLHVDIEKTELYDTTIQPEMLNQKQGPSRISEENDEEKLAQISHISTGKIQEMVDQRHKAINDSEAFDTNETEPVADVPKGMVQELVKKRHEAIETREVLKYFPEASVELPKTTAEPIIEQSTKDQEIPTSLQEKATLTRSLQIAKTPGIDEIGVIETSDGRRKCPICGNDNLRQIREVEDKTKIISAYPRMYGKKFKCGQCGAEWR